MKTLEDGVSWETSIVSSFIVAVIQFIAVLRTHVVVYPFKSTTMMNKKKKTRDFSSDASIIGLARLQG